MFEYNDKEIHIVEVGPRDGLQNESEILSLEVKLEYIKLLAASGLKTIEATSFIRAEKIPQMGDSTTLYKKIMDKLGDKGINFPCLVPNLTGYEFSQKVGVKEISLFSATSDQFTLKNINCTIDESFIRMEEVAEQAKKDKVKMRGYISTAFGCPYAGEMKSDALVKTIEKFLGLGVYEISIGDTIGIAHPKQVYSYLGDVLKVIPASKLAMHFHDTRGLALTNILVSLEKGIRTFDTSSGGLGGCPYAKGATGNVATEDVLNLLNNCGLKTGVNIDQVAMASKFILGQVNKQSPSKFFQTNYAKES